MDGGLGNLLSEVIFRYFSFSQLHQMKRVSRYWYRQCRRSHHLQTQKQKVEMIKDINSMTDLDVLNKNHFCVKHMTFKCKGYSKLCRYCSQFSCETFGDCCVRCLAAWQCVKCKLFTSKGLFCSVCQHYHCVDCNHVASYCKGIKCFFSTLICGGETSCGPCKNKSVFTCYLCKEKTVCSFNCREHHIVFLCITCNKANKCPLCENGCSECYSSSCEECRQFVCLPETNNGSCKMVKFGESFTCLSCAKQKLELKENPNKRLKLSRKCKKNK